MFQETITLPEYPKHRFTVMQDTDASEPIAESGVNVHYYVCESAHYGSSNTEPNGEYAETFARFLEIFDTYDAFVAFRRWLHIYEEWSQWARGDVYRITAEKFVPCNSPETCHGDEESHWEYSDEDRFWSTVSGIYADDSTEAAKVYAESYI